MISRITLCSAQPAMIRAARFGPIPVTSRRRSGSCWMTSNTASPKARTSFLDITDDQWLATFNLNFHAARRMSRAAVPATLRRALTPMLPERSRHVLADDAGGPGGVGLRHRCHAEPAQRRDQIRLRDDARPASRKLALHPLEDVHVPAGAPQQQRRQQAAHGTADDQRAPLARLAQLPRSHFLPDKSCYISGQTSAVDLKFLSL